RAGWRGVTCHAIGNLGVETCVGAIEDALRREPAGAGRVRLDHGMFLSDEVIRRIAALGIWVVGQPSFVYDLGPGPAVPGLHVRAFGTLRAAGIPQAFSSDFPCGTLAPLTGIYAAVTRRARSGEVGDLEEAVPVATALQAYTLDAARAAGLEAVCGSLEAGKRADLVVLSGDPLATPPESLLGLRVVATWVAGRAVHAEPAGPSRRQEGTP
ncbi:MAG: amidohydrolase family protein, partial [Candidatus Rokubacteria bacterium]|nr:amidohydrolase family protein [Candidatus Rokubacteria bacterium]